MYSTKDTICEICCEKEEHENYIFCVLGCKKAFCILCYDTWQKTCFRLHNDITCPICRKVMEVYEEEDYSIYENEEEEVNNQLYTTYENNIYTEYYDEEKSIKSFSVSKINNMFQNEAITYWENGNIFRICNWLNDKLHGICKEYDEHNNLYCIYYTQNNNLHGFYIKFDKFNNIVSKKLYINSQEINNSYLRDIKLLYKEY